jgi:hypothetical protein
MEQPVITLIEAEDIRLFRIGKRHYVEAGTGKECKKKLIPKKIIEDKIHLWQTLRWDEKQKKSWLRSNVNYLLTIKNTPYFHKKPIIKK